MRNIYIDISGQKLAVNPQDINIVDGTQDFIRFVFHTDGEWSGLNIVAHFMQVDQVYKRTLNEDMSVMLPSEITSGGFTLALCGSGDKTIATSNYLTFRVYKEIFLANEQSTEITPSLYNQLVDKVNSIASWDVEGVEEITGKVNSLMDVDVSASKDGTVTTVTVTGKDGIPHSIEILDGKDGKTPVKGTDYFTEADKQELVNAVIAALPNGDEVEY